MSELKRRVGHWKVWGFSCTCSECGFSGLWSEYCPECGSIMSDPEESWIPPMTISLPVKHTCSGCNIDFFGDYKYCPKCGKKQKEVKE